MNISVRDSQSVSLFCSMVTVQLDVDMASGLGEFQAKFVTDRCYTVTCGHHTQSRSETRKGSARFRYIYCVRSGFVHKCFHICQLLGCSDSASHGAVAGYPEAPAPEGNVIPPA